MINTKSQDKDESAMDKISVMIVDDEKSVRNGLQLIINAEPDMFVSEMAINGRSALEKLAVHQPDVILVDIQMPVMDGLECIRHITALYPSLTILVLTTFNDSDYIVRCLALGATGYLIKGTEIDRFSQHIRDTFNDCFILPSQVAVKLSQYLLNNSYLIPSHEQDEFSFPDGLFTKKEQELILLLQTNITLKDMAVRHSLSEGTLRNYLSKIYHKLNVSNRQEALLALQRFIIAKPNHQSKES
jgi:DNA-binding NarL/FixJ family response regulator